MKQTAQGVIFEITDTGRGIAAEDLPHIFDRFYQSKTQDIAEGGTGIGLAICREFVTLMHGKIEAQSTLGNGTTFKCSLPLRLLQEEQTEATTLEITPTTTLTNHNLINIKNEKQPLATVQNNNVHLLLVEDNEDLQQYITFLLTKYYRLTVVNNGKLALTFLDNCNPNDRPSLILSDIMMPEMDGFELLKHLKSSTAYHKIPTIMLTARAGIDDRLKALRIGVDDYLTKPFLEEELLVRIDNLLSNAAIRMDFQTEDATLEKENSAIDQTAELDWLKTVETYILENKHLTTFSVSTISETFGMSRQLFNKRIGEEVGMTALNYIREIQLNEARKLLENKKVQSVKELAVAIGFANPKLLSRKFVERFGKYPSDYL